MAMRKKDLDLLEDIVGELGSWKKICKMLKRERSFAH